MSFLRRRAARLATLGAAAAVTLAVAASPAAAEPPIPSGGATITHASLDWTGDLAMQGQAYGQANFFSAGVSKGTEATYQGAADNAEVLLEGEGGKVATWATHLNYTKEAGHHQVVRLTEGVGRVEADGSAEIDWDSTFTVNYYGTLAPFTIEDPKLTIDADGEGELTANLIGCRGKQGCTPLAPVPDATIATFSGASVNDLGEVTITPDYEGVEVDTGTATPQDRTVAGWGAWPQDMVTFQVETELSSFFYSSGSSGDAEKPPLPFTVDFTPEVAVAGASLDWTGNELMQTNVHGFKNYFSAGPVPGTDEASYTGEEEDVQIYLGGSKKIATWATHENYGPAAGENQVVHLSKGIGTFEQFGGAEVEWEGAFSVNFYAGMAPFTVEDPVLVVEPDGTGELTATLVGCEASMAEPNVCTPFAPATDVQLATFSGVEVTGDEVTITPDYDGVEVTSAGPYPQNKTETGWGAWPQSFVSFQDQTGLSPYFYSAGFPEDAEKAGAPFLVDFAGKELEITPEEATNPGGGGETPSGGGSADTSSTSTGSTTPTETTIHKPAKLTVPKATKLSVGGTVKVATLSCPAGGTVCRTVVPSRVAVKIGGKRYVLTVFAPAQIGAGKSAAVKVRLPKAAHDALGAKKLALKLRVGLVANGITTKHVVKVKIAGRK